ncbi:hypothetical protein GCM10010517_70910 [Streptosporangium fragile]|uniref:Uncharacterized protein n=1 Tax=Streptosporangium fragile TaxID=46186 RepID=A0ABN3W8U9_9ACTN
MAGAALIASLTPHHQSNGLRLTVSDDGDEKSPKRSTPPARQTGGTRRLVRLGEAPAVPGGNGVDCGDQPTARSLFTSPAEHRHRHRDHAVTKSSVREPENGFSVGMLIAARPHSPFRPVCQLML